MKKEFKKNDVVMIKPHKGYITGSTVGNIGLVIGFLFPDAPIVKIEGNTFAYFDKHLFKIGTL